VTPRFAACLALALVVVGSAFSCARGPDPLCAQQLASSITSVDFRFIDPRRIAVEAADGTPLIAEGSAPQQAQLASGGLATGAFSSGRYSSRLSRDPSGALVVDWQTDLAMAQGSRQVLVGADGSFFGLYGVTAAQLGFPEATRRPELVVDVCPELDPTRAGYVPAVGPCQTGPWQRLRLRTAWANVGSAREVTFSPLGQMQGCPPERTERALFP
jgi:hypothetical protein